MPQAHYSCGDCHEVYSTMEEATACEEQDDKDVLLQKGDSIIQRHYGHVFVVSDVWMVCKKGKHDWHYRFATSYGTTWRSQAKLAYMLSHGWEVMPSG